jgi:Tfp pilus assembly protein PilV
MLVEVMMSALLVALAATAVFKGIDGATATSAQSRSRATATSLVQEDQERMRAMDPRKLSSYSSGAQPKVVNGVTYTLTSTGQVVSDRADAESCTKASGRVTYVRITSKVTWPEMTGSKPVSESSLVAISNAYSKGSLAIKIKDRNAAAVPGVSVAVNSPVALSGTTNNDGCVVWDGLNTGAYFGSFSKTGYVDQSGENVVTPVNGWNVTTGSTAISTHIYDAAGSANFKFVGKIGATQTPPAKASGMTVKHINMPTANNVRSATFTPSTSYTLGSLFPFLTPYTAWAGSCSANTPPTGGATSVTIPAGGTTTPDPVIEMPVINLRVRKGGSNYATVTGDVSVRPVDPTCGPEIYLPDSDTNGVPGANEVRALPYGSYVACADDNTRRIEQTVNLTSTAAVTATDLNIPTSGTSSQGQC